MEKHVKKRRAPKKANNGWFFGELRFNCRVVLTRTVELLKSKRVLMAILSAIIAIMAVVRYFQKMGPQPLSDSGKYVNYEKYDKVRRERDEREAKCQALEDSIDEHTSLRDSLHALWNELNNNLLIYPQGSGMEMNKHIQRVLRACRAYEGPIDGNPINTYLKVENFQNSKELKKIDGIIGPETWDSMINELETVMGKPGSLESYRYPS